jgi:hypothetical protein
MSTAAAGIKNCNFSCTCNRDDCERKHYIEDKEVRVLIKEIFDTNFDRKVHNETDPDGVRNIPCFYGSLCSKTECTFRHYCSFEFRREIMSKKWRKVLRKDNKDKVLADMQEKYSISDDDMEKLAKL